MHRDQGVSEMSHEATVRHLYGHLTAHDADAFGEHLADDFVEHEDLPGEEQTRDGVKAFFNAQFTGFSDFAAHVEDVVDGGDKVVARVRFTGTHDGEFMGMPPTGKAIDVPAIDILLFGEDGLIHAHWGVFDAMAMMQQLGVVPRP